MDESKFSYKLMELGFYLSCVINGGSKLTDERIKQIYEAICKAQNIVQFLENRKRSLNNLKDEVKNYMDEYNKLID